ncbi:RidA family protein [Microbacterium sp. LWH3-1.2]|uniref:RidA family protein n=1 Tax=Microbacterium sp. LWH3-1.2 TaxID=3135256 RepID=UPI00343681F9
MTAQRLTRVPAPVVPGISDSVIDTATGLVYVSGVYVPVPDDFARSTELTFRALEEALVRAGTNLNNLVRVNIYVKHLDEEKLQTYRRVRDSIISSDQMPASTLVGVHSLYNQATIEIDAIAVL